MAIKVANNQSLTAITALPSAITGGAMTLLETQTASSSATLSFTSNIDSTYDEYIFRFYDIHPATDAAELGFQANASGGSGYNETITSSYFRAVHSEADDAATLSYDANRDQAQGTGFQEIASDVGNENDQSTSGYLHLFNPSSTTFVKHFILRSNVYIADTGARDQYVAGYINTTSAITEIQFKMSSGNIDSGVIKLYGIS
jgi:hypothetical protein